MIVVDTNIVAYYFISGPSTHISESIRQKDSDWIAPHLWKSEFLSVLSKYLVAKQLNFNQAVAVFKEAMGIFQDAEYLSDPSKVLSLILESSCSSYDCEFVSLAQEKNIFFITADKKIVSSFPDTAILAAEFIR